MQTTGPRIASAPSTGVGRATLGVVEPREDQHVPDTDPGVLVITSQGIIRRATREAFVRETSELVDIVRDLLPHREALTADVIAAILQGIPEFADDMRLKALLAAAATENVSACMHAIAMGASLDTIDAPAAGIEHARILAQREVAITVLLRAYRLGQARFIEGILELTRDIEAEFRINALDLVRAVSLYIDRISEQVTNAYEVERELWVGSKAALRQHWVGQLLSSDKPDVGQAESALRYRLDGWHVAVEAWVIGERAGPGMLGDFDKAASVLRNVAHLRGEYLSVPTDSSQVRMWLSVPESFSLESARLEEELVAVGSSVRFAIGPRRRGVAGFRSSANAARKIKALSMGAGARSPQVLSYVDVAPMALLVDNQEEVRAFVSETLGDLASFDPRCRELRDTLLVYLESNRSYHIAAKRLHVHRNTVHYRVAQAMEQVGADVGDDTLALQLALNICRWTNDRP